MESWADIPDTVENGGQLPHSITREAVGDARTTISNPDFATVVGTKKSVTSTGQELYTFILLPLGGAQEHLRASPVGPEYARQLEAQRRSTDLTGSFVGYNTIYHPSWDRPKYVLSSNNLTVDPVSLRRRIRDGTQTSAEAATWLLFGPALDREEVEKAEAADTDDHTVYGPPSPRGTYQAPAARPQPKSWDRDEWQAGYSWSWDHAKGCWQKNYWSDSGDQGGQGGWQKGQGGWQKGSWSDNAGRGGQGEWKGWGSTGSRRRHTDAEEQASNKHQRTAQSWTGLEKDGTTWSEDGTWQVEGDSSAARGTSSGSGAASSGSTQPVNTGGGSPMYTATYSGKIQKAVGATKGDMAIEEWQRRGVETPWAPRLEKFPDPKPEEEVFSGFFNHAVKTLYGEGRPQVSTQEFVQKHYSWMNRKADAGVLADRIMQGRGSDSSGHAYSDNMEIYPSTGLVMPTLDPDRDPEEDGGHYDWDREMIRSEHPVLPHPPSSGVSLEKNVHGHLYVCTDPKHQGNRVPQNLFKILPLKVDGSTLNVCFSCHCERIPPREDGKEHSKNEFYKKVRSERMGFTSGVESSHMDSESDVKAAAWAIFNMVVKANGLHKKDPIFKLEQKGVQKMIHSLRNDNPLQLDEGMEGAKASWVFPQVVIGLEALAYKLKGMREQLGSQRMAVISCSLDFCRMVHGRPRTIGCVTMTYVCKYCGRAPYHDFTWFVTTGHGTGLTGWWCAACGEPYCWEYGGMLVSMQMTEDPDSIIYFQAAPPPDSCRTMLELLKMTTNMSLHNNPFTNKEEAIMEQVRKFITVDNKLMAMSTPQLAATMGVQPIVYPKIEKHKNNTPHFRVVQDQKHKITLEKEDVGRQEAFVETSQIPKSQQGELTKEGWLQLLNLIYLIRTYAETSLGGLTPVMPGKGTKVKLLRHMNWATTIRQTGCAPGETTPVSAQQLQEAQDWLPFPEAARTENIRALRDSVEERDELMRQTSEWLL